MRAAPVREAPRPLVQADARAHAAQAAASHANDASPIAAILTAIGCFAAFACLLRRMLTGF